jgi:hypothetical protein
MKKVCLTVIGLYILLLNAFSQIKAKDSTVEALSDDYKIYTVKPLKLEETNIVSSYYDQNGNHSAVTGGIGTEKVTDISNGIELKFVGSDADGNKHTLTTGIGLDHHTAASSAYVSKTGASKTNGTRIYPSIGYSMENQKGTVFGFGAYYSAEYNYHSFALDAHYSHKIGKGGELSTKVSAYFDKVKLIYPSELIPTAIPTSTPTVTTSASGRRIYSGGAYGGGDNSIPTSPRNTYTGSMAYSQIINKSLQISLLLDLVAQHGYLSLPFHRVYLNDATVHVENLPNSRYKLPIGFRLNYFMGDNVIFRTYYRYFMDDWGIHAHTASLEIPVKITPFFSISPFYRYYTQTAATFFAPYKSHTAGDKYYTSNYSYAALSSNYFGVGIHLAPPGGILKTSLSSLEIRYGHYTQTTDLNSNVISVAFQLK